ncbi:MAG: undecaprenyl-phosphate glucose phosphotransferase [Clostridia bacterium]|nr:undecaprenyl-phosphate glucose phosphotransferase [Clostridia bacterium]
MIKKNQRLINQINMLIDGCLVVLAYVLGCYLWLDVLRGGVINMADWANGHVLPLACLYAGFVLMMLMLFGFYNSSRRRKLKWKIKTILFAVSLSLLIGTTLLFIFELQEFSRGVLLLFYVFMLAFLMGKYWVMRHLLRYLRKKGYNIKHVLIIGTGHLAQQYAEDIRTEKSLGFRVKGFVGKETEGLAPYLGDFDQLDTLLAGSEIDEAVIAVEPEESKKTVKLIRACEKSGTPFYVVPFYNDVMPARPQVEVVGRTNLIRMRSIPLENYGLAALKRLVDVLVSGAGLLVLSPLLLLVALGVKLSSPGPIFFKQERIGFHKKPFMMYKFRSLRMEQAEKDGWSNIDADRRTPFGNFIRKFSLDEFPQLFNVLRGDMSLVGPRPELPKFVEEFKETVPLYMVKHQVRPGMTGWAQVNGYRGDTSITKRVEMDIWYIENWTPALDLKILVRTFLGGMVNREKLYKKREQQDKGQSV